MQQVIEHVMRKLLTELRNVAGGIPSVDTYFARQYANGYVGYYKLNDNGHGSKKLVALDSADPYRFFDDIVGRYIQEIAKDPKKQMAADELIRLGVLFIQDRKEEIKEFTWKYHKDIFPTPQDIPDVSQQYNYNYDHRENNTLKVDHIAKSIDLDQNYLEEYSRRGDPRHDGANARYGKSYVIPSGKVAFEGNELGLQKLVKFLMQQDSRITPDYKILGDEKYRKMNVSQLVKKSGEVETALTGRTKLVMFHGTSLEKWNIIQKTGLRPGAGDDIYADLVKGWSEKNVYLTFTHDNAQNYATRQAIKDGSPAAVLRVEIPDVSKLVADEDTFGYMNLSKRYTIQTRSKDIFDFNPNDYEPENLSDEQNVKTLMRAFGNNEILMDNEGKMLYDELMQFVNNNSFKKSLKKGVAGYRGMIPSKFIQLDMTYKKQAFSTSERKGGPDDEEYNRIRTTVLQKAKRYDESLRRFIANVISETRQYR